MMLCLDVGNTHILGGIYQNNELLLRFRYSTVAYATSDQLGIFLKTVLRENGLSPKLILKVALCSVVPSLDYSLRAACIKYFHIEPFCLTYNTTTDIIIKTKNPEENGTDIIAGIIAAAHNYPKKNIIVIDLGTVTTIAVVNSHKEYLGVNFIPGLYVSMNALQSSTANLFPVKIIKPKHVLGSTTIESIQSGLFFGHLGAIKELTSQITKKIFANNKPLLIASGGFAYLFAQQKIFDYVNPDLILYGIKRAYEFHNHGVIK